MHILFCLFVLSLRLLPLQASETSSNFAHEFVSNLPLEERFQLDYFFRSIIQQDSAGYVILGGKPSSVYTFLKPQSTQLYEIRTNPIRKFKLFLSAFHFSNSWFGQGFKTWEKYKNLFCGDNILFESQEANEELHYINLFIINKSVLIKTIKIHPDKIKVSNSISNQEKNLFNKIVQQKFHEKQDVLGICLGYGRKNAELFQKFATLYERLGTKRFSPILISPVQRKNMERELASIQKKLKYSSSEEESSMPFQFVHDVGFRANLEDKGTLALIKKYKELKKILTQKYAHNSFLEKTLELIMLADKQRKYPDKTVWPCCINPPQEDLCNKVLPFYPNSK